MLGTYNVNGAPCELLVEQDALTWWPRRASRSTSHDDGSATSPLKTHLRRLSNASSVIFSNNSSSTNNTSFSQHDSEACDSPQEEGKAGSKKRIEFSQVVGLKHIGPPSKRSRRKKGQVTAEDSGSRDDKSVGASREQVANVDKCDEGSQVGRGTESEIRGAIAILNKLKLYYVRRNEKKSSGRLMKLKKISIEPLGVSSKSKAAREKKQEDEQHAEGTDTTSNRLHKSASNVSSSGISSVGTTKSVLDVQESQSSALRGLLEAIEQNLENQRRQRPKRLLVFVNPFGGKGRAMHLYKSKVRKVLELAQVECELVVTKYANHARDTIEDPMFDVNRFDGIICVGGDGMFAELMNGLLFRCNRDKLLASELSSFEKRSSDSLSAANTNTTTSKMSCSSSSSIQFASSDSTATTQSASSSVNDVSRNHHNHHDASTHFPVSRTSTPTNDNGDHNPMGDNQRQQTPGHASSKEQQLKFLRSSLGGIGEQFVSPSIPIGVIGAGSTDANLFGFIGTNDAVSATLNIVMGSQIQIDVCSIHSIHNDRLLRFVSTFVAYGYFGDVIRESEKLRWLGPSRYDVTALNSLIKYRQYQGLVRILRSSRDGTPLDLNRCHLNCHLCSQPRQHKSLEAAISSTTNNSNNNNVQLEGHKKLANSFSLDEAALARAKAHDRVEDDERLACSALARGHEKLPLADDCDQFEIIEEEGSFVGVNAAVTACRCPQTRKGFSPGNHLANGCADLILVRPCSRMQYINYLIRTGYTKKSAFDLKYVDAYRCRQFEFIAQGSNGGGGGGEHHLDRGGEGIASTASSWNADGEILREESIRVKVNNRLLRVFGTGEPQRPRKRGAKSTVN